jgi:hypothetical protein
VVQLLPFASDSVVAVAVGVEVAVDVAVAVLVDVAVFVGVLVGVSVGVDVGVFVGVAVGVLDGVLVGVSVGVDVAVLVGVFVGVAVGVCVAVAVGVSDRQRPERQISPLSQHVVPQVVVPLTQRHCRRRKRSFGPQTPEQQFASSRQISPPSRHSTAPPRLAQRIDPTGPPIPMPIASVRPNFLSIERRDCGSASSFARASNRRGSTGILCCFGKESFCSA